MNTDKRGYPMVWVPIISLIGPQSGPWTLAVELPTGQKMTLGLLKSLLYDKLVNQIKAEESLEDAARIARTMLPNGWNLDAGSAEHLATFQMYLGRLAGNATYLPRIGIQGRFL